MRITESPEHLKEALLDGTRNTYDNLDTWLRTLEVAEKNVPCEDLWCIETRCEWRGKTFDLRLWYLADERMSESLKIVLELHKQYFNVLKQNQDSVKRRLLEILSEYLQCNTPYDGIVANGYRVVAPKDIDILMKT